MGLFLGDTRYTTNLPRLKVSELSRSGDFIQRDCSLDFSLRLIIFAEAADDQVTVNSVFLNELSGKTLRRGVDIVSLEHQRMPGGGSRRSYFQCPVCGKRCMAIFVDPGEDEPLRCRTCAGVAYVSQRKTPLERKSDRIQKLRRKLGSYETFGRIPPRPSGMHRRTYARIANELEALQGELLADIDVMQDRQLRSSMRRFVNVTDKTWFKAHRDLMDGVRAIFAEGAEKAS